MKYKRLKLSAILLFGFGLMGLQAQTMYVLNGEGRQTGYALSSIKYIKFSDSRLIVQRESVQADNYFLINTSGFIFNPNSEISYPVNASVMPANSGTIIGTGRYNGGTDARLIAIPAAGYTFTEWTMSGLAFAFNDTTDINVNSNKTIVANFNKISTDIAVQNNECELSILSPNPVSDVLTIDLTGVTGDGTICILTLEGIEMLKMSINSNSLATFNLSNFPHGVYLFKYSNELAIKTVKFIKQ